MNLVLRHIAALIIVFALPVYAHAQPSVQGGYSTEPLREPVFDLARVTVETTVINNWLNANYQRLSYKQMKGPREHLYYLIDSRIKDTFARSGKILPTEHDVILEILFSWTEQLGAFGGASVYNRLRSPLAKEMSSTLRLPKGMSVGLKDDLLTVKSFDGRWSVEFPYYFMLWNVADFDATNGLRTQLIALSTGTAKDKSQLGHSQATLLLIFSPGADPKRFSASWRKQLGIPDKAEEKKLGVRDMQAQHRFDSQSKLHMEFVSWAEKQGPFTIFYSGIDGTYQWNRPHFLDFVRAVRIE